MTGNTTGIMQVAGDLDKSGLGVMMRNEARVDRAEEEVGGEEVQVTPSFEQGRGSQTFWSRDPFTHLN